jgi:hypothetical protein
LRDGAVKIPAGQRTARLHRSFSCDKRARQLKKLTAITAEQFDVLDMTRYDNVCSASAAPDNTRLLTQKPAVIGIKRHI